MNDMSSTFTWTRTVPAAFTDAMSRSSARTGASMAVVSMLFVQLGLAASVGLIDQVGRRRRGLAAAVLGRACCCWSSCGRGPRRSAGRPLRAGIALGVVTAGVTLLFMAAVARLPLGTASALEFLGPLGVAVVRSRGVARAWALVAAAACSA